MNVWLSVDWDYFTREDPKWDWGHQEDPLFYELIWKIRQHQFERQGLDIVAETCPDRHAKPRPAIFWEALKTLGFDLSCVDFVGISNSHSNAYQTFRERSAKSVKLYNFDAHHDLGYKGEELDGDAGFGRVNAENWLGMLYLLKPSLRAEIVYPAWKGLVEWKQAAFHPMMKRFARPRVFDVLPVSRRYVEVIHICKSSAWTPPWHDGAFQAFVGDLYNHIPKRSMVVSRGDVMTTRSQL
jgi:hypothetical protein